MTIDTPKGGARVFLLCFLAGLCEGYDMMVAGVTAPKFAPVFQLDPGHLGAVFSAATLGLFVGALIGGRLADRVGRRTVLIVSLAALGLFSVGTALVDSTPALLLMRFLAGLGLGGVLPNILALTAESGRPERVATRVTMLGSAMPLGGGLVALLMMLVPDIDWRTVFWIGGLAPLAMAVVIAVALPESAAFRAEREARPRVRIGTAIAGEGRLPSSILLWFSSFCTALALYMLINWLPTLLVGNGVARADAARIAMLLTVGGAASGFVFGALLRLRGRRWIYVATWAGMLASIAGLALFGRDVAIASAAGFGAGFFLSGGQFLLYARSAELYPTLVRGTGVGFAVGIGRLGAVAGPLLAGAVLAAGAGATGVLSAVAPLIVLALVAALLIKAARPGDAGQARG